MTTFNVTFEIGNLDRSRWESVEALADSGSSFTVVPADILQRLGVEPTRTVSCELADGRFVESDIGEARTRIGDSDSVTLVLFGRDGEPSLLGAHDLEAHLLAVDPVNERLVPVHALRMPRRR